MQLSSEHYGQSGPTTQKKPSKGDSMRDKHSRDLDDDNQVMSKQLHDVIVACADRHPGAGAHELAAYVAQYSSVSQLRSFATELISGACRAVLKDQAHGSDKPRGAEAGQRRAPRPVSVPATVRTPLPAADPRSGWQALLDGTVHVGAGEQKPLGACTVADLQFCIKDRDSGIGRLEDQISHMRHLISLMQRTHADRVAELPLRKQWRSLS
ncbi:uncharacterized protein RMCFA_1046 [Mycolicibacterium fortuitum subsp. acetamidolyticum]|nr:uncharacterized protein RMCFA_1046 [Mycolicibacterium fortuitum subsp. acetamidolyticum]